MSSPVSDASLSRRIATVDLLRGLLMIVMALDHTRDFFSNAAAIDATSPSESWPALFFTRWITHLCAPGFVALAGTSVYLQRRRGRSATQTAQKLVTRGLWLIFLEFAVVSFGIFFTWSFHFMQVIYAIGGSMIVLALLQFLPTWAVATYGLAIVSLHNLLDGVKAASLGGWVTLWKLFVMPGPFLSHGKMVALCVYPILPWSGVMALGYAFGVVVAMPAAKRRAWSLRLGGICLAVFALLRALHLYGDPVPFTPQPAMSREVMSFLQLTKYPPSLEYVLATFGVLLLLFALFDLVLERGIARGPANVVEIYGRVPFFYYVPHFYLIHVLAVATSMIMLHSVQVPIVTPFNPGPPQATFSLPVVYAIWIAVVASLYYPCKWFAGLKARRRDWWLSYL